MATNPELELAFDYVNATNRHLYLTGKAGTGKTTFLHRVRREVSKRMAVVAPTGVAAINAKGTTIHSLFQLPFGVLPPGSVTARSRKFSRKKVELIKSLDLLVIDEISMVRADVLDGIDEVLRRLRRDDRPFGGVQLLMIGDLHQLPPVVRDEDREVLRQHYQTTYFFGSHALRKADPVTVQLRHIYRQQNEDFIGLLNRVRNDDLDAKVLDALNRRYQPNFDGTRAEGYITLTSHNAAARRINDQRLAETPGRAFTFHARIEDAFPESMYPNSPDLIFKVGAQVMFNKNDTLDHLYFNGKIGTIVGVDEDTIEVACPGEDSNIFVEPVTWENRKFELNATTREVEDYVVGTYTQHPLRLAWAITIHKSQGLTFDKVVIDAADAFAHGQVYVALSRCRTFEGIVLSSRLGGRSVRTDAVVSAYTTAAADNPPTREALWNDKRRYQLDCLRAFFLNQPLREAAARLRRALLEHEPSLAGETVLSYNAIYLPLTERVLDVGKTFVAHLNRFGKDNLLPEEHPQLLERLAAGVRYFTTELQPVRKAVAELDVITDNQKTQKIVLERKEALERALYVTDQLLRNLRDGFSVQAFVRCRADATVNFDRKATDAAQEGLPPKEVVHGALYTSLFRWRRERAVTDGVGASRVLAAKSLFEIDQVLPTERRTLLRVKGLGLRRADRYGEEILGIIRAFVADKNLDTDRLQYATGAKGQGDTKRISLELYQEGKSPGEIAELRDCKETTVLTHLSYYVALGELPVTDFLTADRLAVLLEQYDRFPEQSLSEAYAAHDGAYDYGEIRMVRAYAGLRQAASGTAVSD